MHLLPSCLEVEEELVEEKKEDEDEDEEEEDEEEEEVVEVEVVDVEDVALVLSLVLLPPPFFPFLLFFVPPLSPSSN